MNGNILDMHYDFKQKLNKVDSQKFADLEIPEVDWKLNDAMDLLIRMIAFPRNFRGVSFEFNQRSIDDLSKIIVKRFQITPEKLDDGKRYRMPLPSNYRHHLASFASCKKGNCSSTIRTTIVQHDDRHEDNSNYKSSFEWETINIDFSSLGILGYTDGTFDIENFYLDFLRTPSYMHAAGAYGDGTYNMPDGVTQLEGYQNCELPALEREIVDLAVLITTGDLIADYQVKQNKLQMTN